MGSWIATAEKEKPSTSVVVDGYSTASCLAGCKQKCYREGIDPLHFTALRRSPLWNNAVQLRAALAHGSGHALLACPELLHYVIELLVHYTVQERLEKAALLPASWKLRRPEGSESYELRPPRRCVYLAERTCFQTLCSNGKRVSAVGYFWYEDVYHSAMCPCPLVKRAFIDSLRSNTRVHNDIVRSGYAQFMFRGPSLQYKETLTAEQEEEAYTQWMDG